MKNFKVPIVLAALSFTSIFYMYPKNILYHGDQVKLLYYLLPHNFGITANDPVAENSRVHWSMRYPPTSTAFTIEKLALSEARRTYTETEKRLSYGDKIKLKIGNLYLGTLDESRVIYAMDCHLIGMVPQDRAAVFVIENESGDDLITKYKTGDPVEETHIIKLRFTTLEGAGSQYLQYNEVGVGYYGGGEIFLAPRQWTIPERTAFFYIHK